MGKFIPEAIGKEIEKACQGIYPLQNTFVRKVKLLRAPKFDLNKLMEVGREGGRAGGLGGMGEWGCAGARLVEWCLSVRECTSALPRLGGRGRVGCVVTCNVPAGQARLAAGVLAAAAGNARGRSHSRPGATPSS